MSDNVSDKNQNEEVDLGQLFNAIGKLFDRLFKFLGNVVKWLFSSIIYLLKPIVNNFKIITIVLMAALILGFTTDKFLKTPVYVSDMLVKPYYDSKYQLSNNVEYFNDLINSGNYKELSNIFEIDSLTSAKQLIGFEIEIGPETQYDLLKEYDSYIQSIDSALAVKITYEDYIEKRELLAGSVFSIKAKSTNRDIFPSLERGFIKTFENQYSTMLKKRKDSIRQVQRQNYLEELDRIESLQETYLEIKKSESNKGEVQLGVDGLIPLIQEKTVTKEYELFQEELKIRNSLRILEENAIEESEFYDILASFEEVGSKENEFYNRYTLMFPTLAFIIMVIFYVTIKLFKFIKEYK
jgi:hypothetical protein